MTSIKQELDKMLKHCVNLCGESLAKDDKGQPIPLGNGMYKKVNLDLAAKTFLKTLASETEKADARAIADKIIAAWDDKTGQLQKELDSARIEQIGNFIVSESTFRSSFFNVISLGPDEEPWYVNETKNEVRVGLLGEDGKPEQVRIVRPQDRTSIGLYSIASDKVQYKIQDIYRGDVSQAALSTIDIARDLRLKLDRIHYSLYTNTTANGGPFGVFSYNPKSGNKATAVYTAHSIIDTTQLPSTNICANGTGTGGIPGADGRFTVRYYDPPSTSYSGFRPAVLLLIEDYCNAWGNALPFGQFGSRLIPTGEVIVPSANVVDMARYLTLVSNTYSNELQEQVQERGYMELNFNGRLWKFIPDNTIPVNTCYPRFNLLPGLSYSKPSWDRSFVKRDEEENWEYRWQRMSYGLAMPNQNRPRALKITYA